jgi:hypothetical protein
VQQVGQKTFYRRGDRWIDAALTNDRAQAARSVTRFSREYFDLIDQHGKETAKYLAFDEPVTVEIDGEAYAF